MVPSAPIVVTALAEIPRRNRPLQIGVINLVTGARNDSWSIFPIVGFVVVSTQIFPPIKPNLQVSVLGKSSVEVAQFFGLAPVDLEASDVAIFTVSAIDGISPENIEGLMERQSELMNNLKTIQPMVDQARQIMNSMPKEFMQKALEGFMKKWSKT